MDGRTNDDAIKCMKIQASDGEMYLGYSGLGLTSNKTEPSQWMSKVLLGYKRTIEESLVAIVEAGIKQLPRHLRALSADSQVMHTIIAVCKKHDGLRLMYRFDLVSINSQNLSKYRLARVVQDAARFARIGEAGETGALLEAAGSGMNQFAGGYLPDSNRVLRHVVNAHDRGRLTLEAMAGHLASINLAVHRSMVEGKVSVGPSCVVSCHTDKGACSYGFNGTERGNPIPIPSVWNGEDMAAFSRLHFEPIRKWAESVTDKDFGTFPEIDMDDICEKYNKLDNRPDPTLK